MKSLFKSYLVNEPYKDPAVYIELFGRKECFLLDLGDISRLSTRKILKISRIFVTHTHIDHFFGFDTVLRLFLGKSEPLHIYGPKNIIKNVKGKLAGYSWNLIKEYPLNIYVHEITRNTIKTALFSASQGLKIQYIESKHIINNIIYEDEELVIKTILLNHKIPVLSFLLEEKIKINVKKDALKELDLEPGPWLSLLKKAYLSGDTKGALSFSSKGVEYAFKTEDLINKLLLIKNGEKILYITDIRFSKTYLEKIRSFASEPDILYCEAFFLQSDSDRAKDRYHLTATQTNHIAKSLRAKKLIIFHFSPRYKGNYRKIYDEAYVDLTRG
ncbi:MAG: ribonuclease Z [bacterium]